MYVKICITFHINPLTNVNGHKFESRVDMEFTFKYRFCHALFSMYHMILYDIAIYN